jgi:hypothetical protein
MTSCRPTTRFVTLAAVCLLPACAATDQARLDRIEEKLDRQMKLLQAIHGDQFAQYEEIEARPGLLDAIRSVGERYQVNGILQAVTTDDRTRLARVVKALGDAIKPVYASTLKSDTALRDTVIEIMSHMKTVPCPKCDLMLTLAKKDQSILVAIVMGLLGRGTATEPGLAAAALAKGPGLAAALRAKLPDLKTARQRFLAYTGLVNQGQLDALPGLRDSIREAKEDALVMGHAQNMTKGGSRAAMWLYLELLNSQRFCGIAAGEFTKLQGKARPPVPRQVWMQREKLRGEYETWLRANYDRISYDKGQGRLVLKAE